MIQRIERRLVALPEVGVVVLEPLRGVPRQYSVLADDLICVLRDFIELADHDLLCG